MGTEDYIVRLEKKISDIMYNNQDMFPIVNDIFFAAEHYNVPEQDIEFYIRYTIESRIGLRYIIRNKCNGVDEIRWVLENDMIEKVEKSLIKSILFEYFTTQPDSKMRKQFETII